MDSVMTQYAVRRRFVAGVAIIAGIPALLAAAPASPARDGQSGLSVRVFAAGNATMFGPDDITTLDGGIYVGWQNGVGSMGEPSSTGVTAGTVIGYSTRGDRRASWRLTGKIDGLSADPTNHRLIATVNEDGNSSLYTISPEAPAGDQIAHYTYNVQPLTHGGGTDAISVYRGAILISASAPTVSDGPAVFRVRLTSRGVAIVQPVFFDNSSATVANVNSAHDGQRVALALTDPDSNEVVPPASPRFAGDFVLDSQGDGEQIYVDGATGAAPRLSVLRLSQSVDDTAWATHAGGTLFVTDAVDNEIFSVRGAFVPGTAYVAVTPGDATIPLNHPNYLGRLDLRTGHIATVVTTIQAKGLVFVP
jgi:hypothetical protein